MADVKKFEVNELLKAATDSTGLADFGPSDFFEGLEVLVNGLNSDVIIPEDRVVPLRNNILRILINRLWFEKDLADHPEILDEEIKSPIIITSLPRTGSTKLHRLLGSSGDFQTLPLWKAYQVARIPGLPDSGREQRIAQTRAFEKWVYQVSPNMITGHPIFTEETEEELMLMQNSFRSISMSVFGSRSHNQWLFESDPSAAYDYLKKQLQYLQWQFPEHRNKPWILKNPAHYGVEAQLCRIFESPRFIVTHRDPTKVIPSVVNITQNWIVVYTEPAGNTVAGEQVSALFSKAVRDHMQWRDSVPDRQFIDVSYSEINVEGIDVARKIYHALDLPLTSDAEKAMCGWAERNPREKHGKHSYSAEMIGTTDATIRENYAEYIKRYGKYF